MMTWKWQTFGALSVVLVVLLFVVAEVEARRGGGGGGRGGGRSFSRSGPASHGSVRTHRAPSSQRTVNRSSMPDRGAAQNNLQGNRANQGNRENQGNRDDLKDRRDEVREDRQQHREDAREDRQDYADDVRDDREDWYDDRYHRRVGGVLTVSAFGSLSCASSTVIVNNVTYYRCGSDWYSRAYSGGNVTYIVVDAPSGY